MKIDTQRLSELACHCDELSKSTERTLGEVKSMRGDPFMTNAMKSFNEAAVYIHLSDSTEALGQAKELLSRASENLDQARIKHNL